MRACVSACAHGSEGPRGESLGRETAGLSERASRRAGVRLCVRPCEGGSGLE